MLLLLEDLRLEELEDEVLCCINFSIMRIISDICFSMFPKRSSFVLDVGEDRAKRITSDISAAVGGMFQSADLTSSTQPHAVESVGTASNVTLGASPR